ncbi:hypothetical protein BV898_00970 [Hypsibius exemplaris]|uniref:Uncharacterized protein n=1 Tax=Hypsibius exemplaris TaxID=2072580 RepID=A0A1W0XCT2_HYPEX|nr:hypothetical protein BV898_00970 [Hypsibius exemplaris]
MPRVPVEQSILRLAVRSDSTNGDLIKTAAQALIQQLETRSDLDRSITSTNKKSERVIVDSDLFQKTGCPDCHQAAWCYCDYHSDNRNCSRRSHTFP